MLYSLNIDEENGFWKKCIQNMVLAHKLMQMLQPGTIVLI